MANRYEMTTNPSNQLKPTVHSLKAVPNGNLKDSKTQINSGFFIGFLVSLFLGTQMISYVSGKIKVLFKHDYIYLRNYQSSNPLKVVLTHRIVLGMTAY